MGKLFDEVTASLDETTQGKNKTIQQNSSVDNLDDFFETRFGGRLKKKEEVEEVDSPSPLTKLSPLAERMFQADYAKYAKQTGINPNPDEPEHFYDYRALFQDTGRISPDDAGHLPSKYKLEGHPRMTVDGINTKTGESIREDKPEFSLEGKFPDALAVAKAGRAISKDVSRMQDLNEEARLKQEEINKLPKVKIDEFYTWPGIKEKVDKVISSETATSLLKENPKELKAKQLVLEEVSKELGIPKEDISKDMLYEYAQTRQWNVQMPRRERVGRVMTGLIVAPTLAALAGGAPAATVAATAFKTVTGVAAFMGIDEAITFIASKAAGKEYTPLSGKSAVDVLAPEDTSELVKDLGWGAQLVLSGILLGKGYEKSRNTYLKVAEKYFKEKLTEYKVKPEVTITPEQLREFHGNQRPEIISKEVSDLLKDLGLSRTEYVRALKNGLEVSFGAEKLVWLVDKPAYKKLKNILGIKSEPRLLSREETEKGYRMRPSGLIEAPKEGKQPTGTPPVEPAPQPPSQPPLQTSADNVRETIRTTVANKTEEVLAKNDLAVRTRHLKDAIDIAAENGVTNTQAWSDLVANRKDIKTEDLPAYFKAGLDKIITSKKKGKDVPIELGEEPVKTGEVKEPEKPKIDVVTGTKTPTVIDKLLAKGYTLDDLDTLIKEGTFEETVRALLETEKSGKTEAKKEAEKINEAHEGKSVTPEGIQNLANKLIEKRKIKTSEEFIETAKKYTVFKDLSKEDLNTLWNAQPKKISKNVLKPTEEVAPDDAYTKVTPTPLMKDVAKLIGYKGRKFHRSINVPKKLDSYWTDGSKDTYYFYHPKTGEIKEVHTNHPFFEKHQPNELLDLGNELVLIKHTIFSGHDLGLTFYMKAPETKQITKETPLRLKPKTEEKKEEAKKELPAPSGKTVKYLNTEYKLGKTIPAGQTTGEGVNQKAAKDYDRVELLNPETGEVEVIVKASSIKKPDYLAKGNTAEFIPPVEKGTITLDTVKKQFPGAEVIQPGGENSPIYIKTPGGTYLTVENVAFIAPDKRAFKIGYGREFNPETDFIPEQYVDGVLTFVRGEAGQWTLDHANMHMLEDLGLITAKEIDAFKQQAIKEINAGKRKSANKDDIGGKEDRANIYAEMMGRRRRDKNFLEKIIDRVKDFLARLFKAFSNKAKARNVTREAETGDIYKRTGTQAEKGTPQYTKTEKSLFTAAKKYDRIEDFIKAQGEPVYHGTFSDFIKFDSTRLGSSTGAKSAQEGFFFATNKNVSGGYASTERAAIEGLYKTIEKIESKIKDLTGKTPTEVIFNLRQNKFDKETSDKLYSYLDKIQRAESQLADIDAMGAYSDLQIASKGTVLEAYLTMENPLVYDMKESFTRLERFSEIIKRAKENGHDSVIIKNTYDAGSAATQANELTDVYIVFSPEQIKTKAELTDIWNKAQEVDPKLLELQEYGTKLYNEGATTYNDWLGKMKEHLGKAYENFKDSLREIYNEIIRKVSNERGSTNEGENIFKGLGKDIADAYKRTGKSLDKLLGEMSTRLGNIHPTLKSRIREFEYRKGKLEVGLKKKALESISAFRKMSPEDLKAFDMARKNSNGTELKRLVTKYHLGKEYHTLREIYTFLYTAAKEVGMAGGYTNNYHAREVKDLEGLRNFLYKTNDWSVYELAFQEYKLKKNIGRPLTQEEQIRIINTLLRGDSPSTITLLTPDQLKRRYIKEVTPEIDKFFSDSDSAFLRYITDMVEAIEARRFFGRGLKDTSDLENSIGAFVMRATIDKHITPAQSEELYQILHARFKEKGTHGITTAIKNISLIDTLGSVFSAIRQLGDYTWALYDFGLITTGKAAKDAWVGKSRITKEDAGISRIAVEFSDMSKTGKLVDWVFESKLTGFSFVDKTGKEMLLNGAFIDAQKKLANPKTREAFIKELEVLVGDRAPQAVKEFEDNKVTYLTEFYSVCKLADYQPIWTSEMPEIYARAGNGRIFYMLKSFTLKMFDVFRREAFQKIKTPGQRAKGIKNLIKLASIFLLANAGASVIQDFLLDRDIEITDAVTENIWQLFGLSRYFGYRVTREGAGTALLMSILPPAKAVNAISKDITEWGDGTGFRVTESVPFVGKIYYWRFGKGSKIMEKQKAKEAKAEVSAKRKEQKVINPRQYRFRSSKTTSPKDYRLK